MATIVQYLLDFSPAFPRGGANRGHIMYLLCFNTTLHLTVLYNMFIGQAVRRGCPPLTIQCNLRGYYHHQTITIKPNHPTMRYGSPSFLFNVNAVQFIFYKNLNKSKQSRKLYEDRLQSVSPH